MPEKIIQSNDTGYWETLDVIDKHFIDVLDKAKVRGITQRRDRYPEVGNPIVAQNRIFLDLGEKPHIPDWIIFNEHVHIYAPVTTYKDFSEKLKADRAILFVSCATVVLFASTVLSCLPNFFKKTP